mmetsp:Transcript_98055/g.277321  ORF Transcript_98055/g.277321 Transcript_98055/m.277321 type:complete len:260 (-) Transcript_98055:428-1207(-)
MLHLVHEFLERATLAHPQMPVPGLQLTRIVHDVKFAEAPVAADEQRALGIACVCRTEGVVQLVELKVIFHAYVRPGRVAPKAAQVVLLRPVARNVGGVEWQRDLPEHALVCLPAGRQEHDARVDASSLAPGPLGGLLPCEKVSAADGLAMVRERPCVHAAAHRRGRRQVEEPVDALEHQNVRVQHQHLFELGQRHRAEFREDMLEPRLLPIRAVELLHALHMVHLHQVPKVTQNRPMWPLWHLRRVHADELVRGACAPY